MCLHFQRSSKGQPHRKKTKILPADSLWGMVGGKELEMTFVKMYERGFTAAITAWTLIDWEIRQMTNIFGKNYMRVSQWWKIYLYLFKTFLSYIHVRSIDKTSGTLLKQCSKQPLTIKRSWHRSWTLLVNSSLCKDV